MKKRAIVIYFLAFALLLSACVYRIPDNTQGSSDPALQGSSALTKESDSTSHNSDTSTPSQSATIPDSTIDTTLDGPDNVGCYFGGYYTEGPYEYRYVKFEHCGTMVVGMALISCDDSVEFAVIPSEVCGIPVVAIDHCSSYSPPFAENSALKSIVIPDTVVYMSNNVFENCNLLTDITLSNSIIALGDDSPGSYGTNWLLKGTAVTFLEVPEGIKRIRANVFADSLLESIVLPSTLETIAQCFDNCPLKKVFYRGTAEQCPQTLLDQVATTEATIYYLSETEPTEEGNFWHYVDGKPVIW